MRTRRLLLVEDNPQSMLLETTILEDAGYVVIPAPDAEQALAAVALGDPDAIVLDIGLPGMDGLALARILKNDRRTERIPIIAVTAFAMRGDRERAFAAGVDAYVSKPIDRPLLLRAIEDALGGLP